jgi:hypothetical protein
MIPRVIHFADAAVPHQPQFLTTVNLKYLPFHIWIQLCQSWYHSYVFTVLCTWQKNGSIGTKRFTLAGSRAVMVSWIQPASSHPVYVWLISILFTYLCLSLPTIPSLQFSNKYLFVLRLWWVLRAAALPLIPIFPWALVLPAALCFRDVNPVAGEGLMYFKTYKIFYT